MISSSKIGQRFWQYQKERFPLLAHGILIASFTFSAMAFSNICRNAIESFHVNSFFKAFINTFLLFLLLRISDEFKDKEFDAINRPHLPVPRGLVTLSELKILGISVLFLLIIFNVIFAAAHLFIFTFVLLYGGLMFKEFFIKHWLEKNQVFYVASHMMIIPLVDTMASSFDWMGQQPNVNGLLWFFAVSFFNGCTLELGRKIKSKDNEEANSYSKALGFSKAMLYFQTVVFITFLLCLGAANYAHLALGHFLVFAILYVVSALFGWYYYVHQTKKNSKLFEAISGIWAIGMYLNLGISIVL
ncbi:MAG: UbiA family prenyltransferase [bacterium]|nr:UbiA family prenyltransferase [bacterium]